MTRAPAVLALTAILSLAGCDKEGPAAPPPPLSVPELLERFAASYQAKDAAAIAAICRYPFEMEGVALASAGQLETLLQSTFDDAGTFESVGIVGANIAEVGDGVTVTGTLHVVDSEHGTSDRPFTIEGVRVDGYWKATSFTQS